MKLTPLLVGAYRVAHALGSPCAGPSATDIPGVLPAAPGMRYEDSLVEITAGRGAPWLDVRARTHPSAPWSRVVVLDHHGELVSYHGVAPSLVTHVAQLVNRVGRSSFPHPPSCASKD